MVFLAPKKVALTRNISLYLFIVLLLLKCGSSIGQQSNLRQKYISTKQDTIHLDSLSIIPQSFYFNEDSITVQNFSDQYQLDESASKLIWLNRDSSFKDSVLVTYRVFPVLFSRTYQRRNRERIEKDFLGSYNPFTYVGDDKEGNLFKLDGLNKSGSISRGITIGNNQDAVVNSSLNLQLAGKLSNNIDVLAAITDDNIPVQAEGNTQQLQEFDKVFIQLSNANHKLIAGDFELRKPQGYFMNFYKKGQGGLYNNRSVLGKNKGVLTSALSGAVSKGKFSRNIFAGTEANQGPYRLLGAQNETFIIILSGSESVFIDGQLMQRGQSGDYIIDYNTSEITFTTNRLITKDSRIVIEFQYSDKNYARTLIFGGTQWEQKKLKLHLNMYSEQDSKNQPLQQDLSSTQKKILAAVGDSIELAISPNVDSIAFNANEILYAKIDTVVSGITYTNVYVYNTNKDSAFYRLGFSFVGLNKGNFIQLSSTTANGKVYAWIAPVNGIAQGSYEPVILLIAPKKRQMLSVGGEYEFNGGLKINADLAGSKDDVNTFSTKDKKNDEGYATLTGIQQTVSVFRKAKQSWKLTGNLRYEYVGKNFKAIENFRPVEFTRDWNTVGITDFTDEHLATAGISLEQKNTYFFNYNLKTYQRGSLYNGTMHLLKTTIEIKKFILKAEGSYLQTSGNIIQSNYYRHTEDLSRRFGIITIGVMQQQEHNAIDVSGTDSLALNSFSFRTYKAYFNTSDTLKLKLSGDYSRRYDDGIRKNKFTEASYADNINANFAWKKNLNNRISGGVTYRKLHISDSILTTQQPDQSLLGRIEHSLTTLKGAVNLNTYYETGTGREQKKEYSYLQVATGTGVYTWNDYNTDSITQLNEFEIAQFQDQANYIRVFTPTNEYVKTYTNQLNIVLGLNPAALYSTSGTRSAFITHFATQSAVRFENKLLGSKPSEALNPIPLSIKDSLLVTTNSSQRHTLYYNRTSNIFGADITFQDQQNKQLLSNGFEFRNQRLYNSNVRWNVKQWLGFNTLVEYQRKQNNSENFAARNFDIHAVSGEQKITYQPGSIYRITASYAYKQKENFLGDIKEFAESHNAGLEFRFSSLKKGLVSAKINFINIAYDQPENTPLAYEMLEGLKPGKNFTWNVSIQRNISRSLQLSLNYDGRKSETVKTIHSGGIQARAFF